jgi:hypothetical protein
MDYVEKTYLNSWGEFIKPFLAKSFGYSTKLTGTELDAEFKTGYKIEARLLDFKILEE